MRGVEQAAAASERSRVAAAQRGSQDRTRAADQEAKAKVRAWAAGDRAVRQALAAGEREGIRAVQQAEREKMRLHKEAEREVSRMARERFRENERLLKEGTRLEERTHQEQTRAIAKRERDQDRSRRAQGRRDDRDNKEFAGHLTTGMSRGVSRISQMTQQTAGLITQLGGGFSIADAVQGGIRNKGLAADIAASGVNPASKFEENHKRLSSKEVMGTAQAAATQYGLDTGDALKGLQNFVGVAGDMKTARETLGPLAELSRATGSSLDDMAAAAGNVAAVLPDTANKGERVMEVMRGIAGQGKMGAVEIRDLSTQMAKLVAASGKFEGDNVENILKLGAMAQAARGGGGAWSAASATTAVNSFTATFGKGARRDAFAAKGVKIDGADNKIRDPVEIIADSIAATGGNIKQMNDLFGSVMGDRAVSKFVQGYGESTKGITDPAKRAEVGKKAVKAQFDDYMKSAPMSKEDVAKAARLRMQEEDAKIAVTMANFEKAVANQLIPKLIELLPTIEKLVPLFVDLAAQALPSFIDLFKTIAGFAESNKGIIADIAAHPLGAIMALEVTKSVVSANIGNVIAKLLGGGGGGPGGGGGGSLTNTGAGTIAALVAGGAYQGIVSGENSADMIQNLSAKVRAHQIAPEAAQKMIDEAKGRRDKAGVGDEFSMWGDMITSPFVDASKRDMDKRSNDEMLASDGRFAKELKKAIADAIAEGAKEGATRAAAAGTPPPPGGPAAATGIGQRVRPPTE